MTNSTHTVKDLIEQQNKLIQEQTEAIERAERNRRLDRQCDDIVDLQRRKNANQQAWLDKYASHRR